MATLPPPQYSVPQLSNDLKQLSRILFAFKNSEPKFESKWKQTKLYTIDEPTIGVKQHKQQQPQQQDENVPSIDQVDRQQSTTTMTTMIDALKKQVEEVYGDEFDKGWNTKELLETKWKAFEDVCKEEASALNDVHHAMKKTNTVLKLKVSAQRPNETMFNYRKRLVDGYHRLMNAILKGKVGKQPPPPPPSATGATAATATVPSPVVVTPPPPSPSTQQQPPPSPKNSSPSSIKSPASSAVNNNNNPHHRKAVSSISMEFNMTDPYHVEYISWYGPDASSQKQPNETEVEYIKRLKQYIELCRVQQNRNEQLSHAFEMILKHASETLNQEVGVKLPVFDPAKETKAVYSRRLNKFYEKNIRKLKSLLDEHGESGDGRRGSPSSSGGGVDNSVGKQPTIAPVDDHTVITSPRSDKIHHGDDPVEEISQQPQPTPRKKQRINRDD